MAWASVCSVNPLGKRLFSKSFTAAPTRQKKIREKREKEIQATLFDAPVEPTTIRTKNHNYLTINTKVGRADLIKKLLAQPRICFDTETTGLNPRASGVGRVPASV